MRWLLGFLLAFLGRCEDQSLLHVGFLGPHSSTASLSIELLVAAILADLDFSNHFSLPKKTFIRGCPVPENCSIPAEQQERLPPALDIPNMHPNLTLTCHIRDTASAVDVAARQGLQYAVLEPSMNAVVGGISDSTAVASILGLLEMVQVAYDVDESLSNKAAFPYFFRILPPEQQHGYYLMGYVEHFGFRKALCLSMPARFAEVVVDAVVEAADQRNRQFDITSLQFANGNFDDARMQVGKIDSGTTRLILMIMTDANEEVQLRQILVEAEITPPRYQFMSTAVTMLVEDPSAYDAFPRWHSALVYRNYTDPSLKRLEDLFNHLTAEDILSRLPEYGIDQWVDPPPYLSVLGAGYFSRPPSVLIEILFSAFYTTVFALNNMLNDGFIASQIRGPSLRAYVQNVSFQGFGNFVRFNTFQDVEYPYYFAYHNSTDSQGLPVWVEFALWRPTTEDELRGSVEFVPDMLTNSDGIPWATGEYAWIVPPLLGGCPPGTYVSLGQATGSCTACPGGQFAADHDSTACSACPGGTFSFDGCECLQCEPGRAAAPESVVCTDCSVGSFADRVGLSDCQKCSIGHYQNDTGQIECKPCQEGSFAQTTGQNLCDPCLAGTAIAAIGQASCLECSLGRFQAMRGRTACQACRAGTFSSQLGQESCSSCLPGTIRNETMSAEECTRCPVGTYVETHAALTCESCPFGSTRFLGADAVSDCRCLPGTFLFQDVSAGDGTPTPTCVRCHEYMEPCLGGDFQPLQRPGYYVSADGRSTYQCMSDKACPSGPLETCREGSHGVGCSTCDSEFYWSGAYCKRCRPYNHFVIVILGTILVLALVAFHWLGNDPVGVPLSGVSEFIILMGLSVSILFYLSSLSALAIEWEEPLATFIDFGLTLRVSMASLHFDCNLSLTDAQDFAMASAVPLAVAASAGLLVLLRQADVSYILNTVGTLFYAGFLLLVLHALKPFRYILHPTGERSVLSLPSVFEGTSDHVSLAIVGVAALLLYCCTFISACSWACWTMSRSRKPHKRRLLLVRFRFLFFKFRPEAFYWGLVVLLRNTLFAVAPSLAPDAPLVEVMVLGLVCVCSGTHTGRAWPWKSDWMNWSDCGILALVAMALLLAAALLPRASTTSLSLLAGSLCVAIGALIVGMFMYCTLLACQVASAGKLKRKSMRDLLTTYDKSYVEAVSSVMRKTAHVAEAFEEIIEIGNQASVQTHSQSCSRRSNSESDPADMFGASLHPQLLEMKHHSIDINDVARIANRIRRPKYTVQHFRDDCEQAFPELALYSFEQLPERPAADRPFNSERSTRSIKSQKSNRRVRLSLSRRSSVDLADEALRTLGALFAVYWICRLDMDGRQGLSFGVEGEDHQPLQRPPDDVREALAHIPWPAMNPEQRRAHFYFNFNWKLMHDLFFQAGILTRAPDGEICVDAAVDGRMVAMLALTAIHDIMKCDLLCPVVHQEAYAGHAVGSRIMDHDMALAYILDRHPELLPSFRMLTPTQQAVVRLTQSEMGFNAGWLVQAEGPPSAVLGPLKRVVQKGKAEATDVAFYFSHWVTDLAGAEPTPYTGTERFAAKFPPPVLQSLLGCFSVVENLADKSETTVYEEYLTLRWKEANLGPEPIGDSRIAKMRLHCMAQGSSDAVLQAYDELPLIDKNVLAREMATTGILRQYFSDWAARGGTRVHGAPLLIYYGPAWMQRVGAVKPRLALRVLAAVYRLARDLNWPSGGFNQNGSHEHKIIQVGVLKTVNLEALDDLFIDDQEEDVLLVKAMNHIEAVLELTYTEA